MEFRLVYKGPLPSATSHANQTAAKHCVRKFLHPQLRKLWSLHPYLAGSVEKCASRWQKCGFEFVPLITEEYCEFCSLSILFLRRDPPGYLINGTDIDNRIKTLFDGLKMPRQCSELGGATPGQNESPFFCLLEDDRFVTELSITTDRLLIPDEGANWTDVELIIHVKTNIPAIDFKHVNTAPLVTASAPH